MESPLHKRVKAYLAAANHKVKKKHSASQNCYDKISRWYPVANGKKNCNGLATFYWGPKIILLLDCENVAGKSRQKW